ncbi:MAG: AraC-like DNA-binding protein [Crocinitomix sp.]|jgi:AraC-like DNA-binding protein
MEVVFIIGSVQSVFLATLVLAKKNKMLADKLLAIWLIFMGIHLFSYYMNVTGILFDYPFFDALSVAFPMLEGAFVFIYVSIITSKVQRLQWRYLIPISPYIIFTAFIMLAAHRTEASPIDLVCTLKNEPTSIFFWAGVFRIYLGPIYLISSLFLLKKHKKNIGRNFSYTEKIDLKWLNYVVGIMSLVWIIAIIANVLSEYVEFIGYRTSDDIIFSSLTIAIFFYGFFGITQQVIYSAPVIESPSSKPEKPKKTTANQYQNSGLKKEDSENYLQQLLQYMDEEAPYLEAKLSLKDVATALEISPNHLSQVINENLNKNFFDFVNEYRVDFVKDKMKDRANENYTLLALAFDSGFNSKSTFNLIFKKHTGQTPTQFMKAA